MGISGALFLTGLFDIVSSEKEELLCLARSGREGGRQLITSIEGLKHVGLDSAERNKCVASATRCHMIFVMSGTQSRDARPEHANY